MDVFYQCILQNCSLVDTPAQVSRYYGLQGNMPAVLENAVAERAQSLLEIIHYWCLYPFHALDFAFAFPCHRLLLLLTQVSSRAHNISYCNGVSCSDGAISLYQLSRTLDVISLTLEAALDMKANVWYHTHSDIDAKLQCL